MKARIAISVSLTLSRERGKPGAPSARTFERIITIFQKVLGPDYPNLAVAIGNYAAILGKLGRDDGTAQWTAQWTAKAEAIRQWRSCRELESRIGRRPSTLKKPDPSVLKKMAPWAAQQVKKNGRNLVNTDLPSIS